MHASAVPEPASYHDARLPGFASGPPRFFEVVTVCEAFTTNDVFTAPLEEVMLIGVTLKDGVAVISELLVKVIFTDPVNPFTGVTVNTMPLEVAPGFTDTPPVQGVIEKSGLVVETTSTDASVPSVGFSSVPFEPA
jgi:hypothetical protein